MTKTPLELTRAQILAHRRRAGSLDERLPPGPDSLRRAAWAGLQDSMPRAAVLSIHARVDGTESSTWEDPSLVQLWGPHHSAYAVAAVDIAVFTLGRLPDSAKDRQFAYEMAAQLAGILHGRRMPYGAAGRAAGFHGNRFRYAAPTGTVLIRWEGARQPTVWTVAAPEVDPRDARLQLARRYLHVFGATTGEAFAAWAGIGRAAGPAAFEALVDEVLPVRTPIGEAWILAADEPAFRSPAGPTAPARLLPSGDAFFLLHGRGRELLVPDASRRGDLWTPRVWPGALLVDGEVAGIWRRAKGNVTIAPWRRLSPHEREAVEAEAVSLPLPGSDLPIRLRWEDGPA